MLKILLKRWWGNKNYFMKGIIMDSFIDKFSSIYSVQLMIMIVGIGLFLILYDSKELEHKELIKEYKVVKYLGKIYIFCAIGIYILLKVVTR